MISQETLPAFHKALDQAGTKSGAAKILGCDVSVVNGAIEDYPELGSYLRNADAPGEATTLVRNKPAKRAISKAEDTAIAVEKLEAAFTQSLKRCGIDVEEARHVVSLQALGQNHFGQLRNFLSGSAVEVYLDLRREYKDLNRQLGGAADDLDPEVEKALREDRGRIVTAMIAIMDRIDKSLLTAALVEAKRSENRANKTAGRPGFSQLTSVPLNSASGVVKTEQHVHNSVHVNALGGVSISTQGSPEEQ